MEKFVSKEFRPQFAGHETFPLRTLWLKKAYEAVKDGADRNIFVAADSIVRFGVGKNMAQAMRHWGVATGIIEELGTDCFPSALGKSLFDNEYGFDPYLEHPTTLWLIHLALAGAPEMSTTWYWAFNVFGSLVFDRDTLTRGLLDLAQERGWKRVAPVTIKRDVDCFIRSYVARSRGGATADAIEPILVELGLIRPSAIGDAFEFVRGPKVSLPDAVFVIALERFWRDSHSEAATLSAEAACYGRGSPGRVFKLDEDSVIERLMRVSETTDGAMAWSETAGLKQVVRHSAVEEVSVLRHAFDRRRLAA